MRKRKNQGYGIGWAAGGYRAEAGVGIDAKDKKRGRGKNWRKVRGTHLRYGKFWR